MFSGIIQGNGKILERTDKGGDRQLTIGADAGILERLDIGGSVAVSGVCLTATSRSAEAFTADVSRETLAVTTLGSLSLGGRVNLEPSLRVGDPVDGHWVTGHVDGVGRITALRPAARSVALTIELPRDLGRYVARKGSITVDGVSLTVNAVDNDRFEVNIIPHTRDVTIISEYARGTPVNIEVDMIARYLERLGQAGTSRISLDMLESHGYASND
jgi:riboflavin synthase